MQYSNGELANMHKHAFKACGTYAITLEWLVSGTYVIQSGAPLPCQGYYGPGQSHPIGYADNTDGAYHWCDGLPSCPGDAGTTPWIHQLDLSVNYIPAWAGKHLTLQFQVYNVFNEQKAVTPVQEYGSTAPGASPNPLCLTPVTTELPRFGQFSVKYDW